MSNLKRRMTTSLKKQRLGRALPRDTKDIRGKVVDNSCTYSSSPSDQIRLPIFKSVAKPGPRPIAGTKELQEELRQYVRGKVEHSPRSVRKDRAWPQRAGVWRGLARGLEEALGLRLGTIA